MKKVVDEIKKVTKTIEVEEKVGTKMVEDENEGLIALLGEDVLLLCCNYFYTGKLVGVNKTCVLLENPSLVYETGAWKTKGYSDSQKLHTDKLYVQTAAIEAFMKSK